MRRQYYILVTGKINPKVNCVFLIFILSAEHLFYLLSTDGTGWKAVGWTAWEMDGMLAIWPFRRSPGQWPCHSLQIMFCDRVWVFWSWKQGWTEICKFCVIMQVRVYIDILPEGNSAGLIYRILQNSPQQLFFTKWRSTGQVLERLGCWTAFSGLVEIVKGRLECLLENTVSPRCIQKTLGNSSTLPH